MTAGCVMAFKGAARAVSLADSRQATCQDSDVLSVITTSAKSASRVGKNKSGVRNRGWPIRQQTTRRTRRRTELNRCLSAWIEYGCYVTFLFYLKAVMHTC